MAQQQFYDTWYLDLGRGETKSQMYALKAGQRAWLTGALLVDPASVAAGKSVRVALHAKNGDDQISISFVLSAERTVAALGSGVMLEDNFWLEREDDDCADAAVQFVGGRVNMLATPEIEPAVEDDDEEEETEDDEDKEIVEGYEGIVFDRVYEMTVPEDSSDDDDGDDEEEEIARQFAVSVADIATLLGKIPSKKYSPPESRFLRGSTSRWFAAAGNTAGFLEITPADADIQEGENCDKEILVNYHYNLFSASSFGGGVEACGVEQRHHIRFIAAAGYGARSLAWVGASLASLIYPGHSTYLLQELWSSLIAGVSIPVHSTRVEVLVDVAIIRPADWECMERIISPLENMLMQPWNGRFNGKEFEMHLPEPVMCVTEDEADGDDTDYEERPAKRRRVVPAGESCTVCLESLEGDYLAAWPRCGKPHVFHAACMDSLLEKYTRCPICRRSLFIGPTF